MMSQQEIPRIFINDTIHLHSSQRGVTRCFNHITDGIIDRFGKDVVIYSPQLRDYSVAKHIRSLPRSIYRGSGRLGITKVMAGINDQLARISAQRERTSVMYSPYYGNLKFKGTQVFTVYDMIHELFPQHFDQNRHDVRSFIAEKKHCFERGDVLVAISQSTADTILSFYPHIDSAKIKIAHLGVDEFFFQGSNSIACEINKPYFLFVGHRVLHKNFLRLLVAFGQSGLSKDFDLRVISPTGSSFSAKEAEMVAKYQLQDSVHLVTSASEVQLRESYRKALAFVYPSEYEGFGLPILEAMASGTLIATSNVSSMPEIGGQLAFYFDPYSSDSIAECLHKITNLSTQQRSDYINQGIAHARTFTWQRCQQLMVNTLSNLT
jgi:glycosyltransferase involved in cell wall biosynthesis